MSDLPIGWRPIALELFGEDSAECRHRVYYLRRIHAVPLFRMGGQLAATRSSLRRYIAEKAKQAKERVAA